MEHADGDVAMGNQVRDIGQGQGNDCGVARDDLLV
jgi:hypothetical protein